MAATKIYVYGFSGHGAVVADVARACGYGKVVFLDDSKFDGKNVLKFDPSLEKADVIVAIGDNKIRRILQERVKNAGFRVVNLIHSSSVVSSSAKIGEGAVVMPNAVINARSVIGEGAIINTGAIIEHDCEIGDFAHVSPNAALAGGVIVGAYTHVGIGSCVVQCIKIGANCIIGAGSVVVRDVPDNVVAYGNPAKVRRNLS
ncbi:UDP-4-amino-4,6-dideoxy-alpha-D-N-acetyl-D-glucosamine N-acetyltransferase [Campylobacter showae]|uniref:Sugar O-acyltransferase, sialic acid O-acetyltransferase NeuD family n=1 Tax=Campylobacter showae RM3277 TaxID=553219 RepID=C6RIK7_9BACT|nr:UDP-N-acetylbacillosamine N-acetyltransferase [Campylobacter showae]EET78750.1 sugar O-acyltransferase, sialic acid O-acetyltransferase NeuD family [Campylobacter showae RM3277]QCD49423.1 UDP-4-amino-4,6-dideoxy-alpha-D-N-acetyl-D-glucosamine N-acetyltransferase [Campylobacter showae]